MLAVELSTSVANSAFQIWSGNDQVWIGTDGEMTFCNPTTACRPASVFVQIAVNGFIRGYIFVPFPLVADNCGSPLDGVAFAVRLWAAQTLVEHASVMWSDLARPTATPTHFSVRLAAHRGVCLPPRGPRPPAAHTSLGPHTYVHATPGTKIPAPLELLFCPTHALVDERWVAAKLAQAVRLLCCKKSIASVPRPRLIDVVSFVFARPRRLTTNRKASARAFPPLDEIAESPSPDTSSVMLVAYHALATLVAPTFVAQSGEVRAFRKRILGELGVPAGGLSKNELVVVFKAAESFTTLPLFEPDTPDYTEISERMKPYVVPFKTFPVPAAPVVLSEEGIRHPAPEHAAPPFMLRPPVIDPAAPFFATPPAIFFRSAAYADEKEIRAHAGSVGLLVSFEEDLIVVGERQVNPFWI